MTRLKALLVLKSISWLVMIALFIGISMAAVEKRDSASCRDLKIKFKNDENLGFIDSRDVLNEVNLADPSWKGKRLTSVKFNLIENGVKQNEYVKKAELYIDSRENINLVLTPKKPLARINSVHGDYYLSEDWDIMSTSSKFSKRIVYISGRVNGIIHPKTRMDSFTQNSLRRILTFCERNTIWQDAIDQIYVNESGKIDVVLAFCKPIVKLGYVDDNFEKRMNKVSNFFRTVMRSHDISIYEELDFQYSQQVVAKMQKELN